MEGWINSRTRMSAVAAMMVLVLMTSTHFAAAQYNPYAFGGRKFTITNTPPLVENPYCPGSTTNTLAFYTSSDNPLQGTVDIVGEFDGAYIGVCNDGNPYSIPAGSYITYAIYGNLIIFQIPDRVPAASTIEYQDGNIYAVAADSSLSLVSVLTDCGPAP